MANRKGPHGTGTSTDGGVAGGFSTFVSGIPELVEAGRTGWLVPAGEVESLTAALGAGLDTPPERLDEMGRAGIERVRARHQIDTEAARFLALFVGREGA